VVTIPVTDSETLGEVVDPRLALAGDLLRSVLEQSGEAQPDLSQPLAFAAPPFSEPRMSATDLLNWWFRPAATTFDPWDDYLSLPLQPSGFAVQPTARPLRPPVSAGRNGRSALPAQMPSRADVDVGHDPAGIELNPWVTFRALFPAVEEELADEHAEEAVECLYGFVHAIARRDITKALEFVADDYHALEGDREIDRLGLRHQLEAMLDSLQGWELEAALLTVPEPLPYTGGILIFAEIQIDAFRAEDDAHQSIVSRRVAVFERQPGRGWLISALSPV
jgi:hypothetical protein